MVTFQVHFNTQPLPSGSPSAHVARTKTLVITTFTSCILVFPAPILWDSLITATCAVSNKWSDFIANGEPCYVM